MLVLGSRNLVDIAEADFGVERAADDLIHIRIELHNISNTSERGVVDVREEKQSGERCEFFGHLLDSASNNHQRFVRAALQSSLTFPGYDQNLLVDLQNFAEIDWNFLVDFWAAYNRFLAHVIGHLPDAAANITCNIGSNPPATLGWIAEDYVAHLKHHLNQILGPTFETSYGK